MVIQKKKYQAEYDIHDMGPNNYDLAVGLTYPNRDNIRAMSFGITRDDGQEVSVGVILTSLKVIGRTSDRQKWEFEGILWNWSVYSKKEGSTTIRARVEGTYDSHAREGKLYVLAHDQPKPLVEVLSWQEVIGRLVEGKTVIEFKHRKNGTLKRSSLTGVVLNENLLHTKRIELRNTGYVWGGIGSGADCVEIEKCSQPLALADGRILFTCEGIDYTIYLPESGDVWRRI